SSGCRECHDATRVHAIDHCAWNDNCCAAFLSRLVDDVHGAQLQCRRTARIDLRCLNKFLSYFLLRLAKQHTRLPLAFGLSLAAHGVLKARRHTDIANFDGDNADTPFGSLAADLLAQQSVALLAIGE